MKNPFNPSFGKQPELFLGRKDIKRSIMDSLDNHNSPWITTLIVGIRGSGKTSLLAGIQNLLKELDIVIVAMTPEGEFLDNILSQVYRQLPKSKLKSLPKLKSIKTPAGLEFSLDTRDGSPAFTRTFRYQLTEMLEILKGKSKHTIFLFDEAQKHTPDMRTFISTYQHLLMENLSVSLVMAGLPAVISDLLNDDVLTFIRRAKRVELENVDVSLVSLDYKRVFKEKVSQENETLIEKAADYTYGYPYLFQLLGYYLWENGKQKIDNDILTQSLIEAKAELFQNVHQLVFSDLSNKDREFVMAMSEDRSYSRIQNIMTRLGKDKGYVSRYRERLITSGVIKPVGHGTLAFTYPYMDEFLQRKKQVGY